MEKLPVKQIFSIVVRGFNTLRSGNLITPYYDSYSEEILTIVSEKSEGFQADIAKKALKGKELTTKQIWCIAFEYKNLV